MKVREILSRIKDLEPDEESIVQKDLDAVNRYEQRFASAVSTMGQRKQEPVDGIRQAVTAMKRLEQSAPRAQTQESSQANSRATHPS